MKWNWEHSEWPNFTYTTDHQKEVLFLQHTSFIAGNLSTLNETTINDIQIEIISEEALKTSEIEGEFLDRKSIQSSIKKTFGLQINKKIPAREQGISEMMMLIYSNFDKKLSHSFLYDLHKKVCGHDKNIASGKYRSGKTPMQIVSGHLTSPKIHFEAPPSERVKSEMNKFIKWFNDTSPNGITPLPCLIQASIAHFYFESIHPFEDGNGRIGRALIKKIISQHIRKPTLTSLSKIIFENQKEYYSQFEKNNQTLSINAWIRYFSDTIIQAQEHTIKRIRFILKKSEILSNPNLNSRQKKVLLRLFKEGVKGFKGGLSADNFITIAKTSRATATRDLKELISLGILKKKGQLKSTRYFLEINTL